jgi:hypothetical protein
LQGEKLLELAGAQLAVPISLQNLSAGVYLLSATTATGETAEMKILKKTK